MLRLTNGYKLHLWTPEVTSLNNGKPIKTVISTELAMAIEKKIVIASVKLHF